MTLDGREQRELASTCSLDVRGRLAPPFREAGEGNSNEVKPKFELFFFSSRAPRGREGEFNGLVLNDFPPELFPLERNNSRKSLHLDIRKPLLAQTA